jgi:hypothetical protein
VSAGADSSEFQREPELRFIAQKCGAEHTLEGFGIRGLSDKHGRGSE